MAGKLTLDETTANQLKMRVDMSLETQLFSLADMREGWKISKGTMYRYYSTEYREKTREYAKARKGRRSSLINCDKCKELVKGHKRCKDCTILLHSKEDLCTSCVDTRERIMLRSLR